MNKNNAYTVVILAGGSGSRMKSKKEKAMHELCGTSMIKILMDKFSSVQKKIIVSSPSLKSLCGADFVEAGFDVVVQEVKNGTGGAVLDVLSLLDDGPVVILYCDTPLVDHSIVQRGLDKVMSGDTDIVFFGFECEEENRYGKFVFDESGIDGEIVRIAEKSSIDGVCNSGVIVTKGSTLKEMLPMVQPDKKSNEIYITAIVDLMKRNGKSVKCIVSDRSKLSGANNCFELGILEDVFLKSILKRHSDNGVMVSQNNAYISNDCIIGAGTVIGSGVVIKKGVKIGKNCEIGSFVVLENCELGDGSVVMEYVKISDSFVEKGSKIDSFSSLVGSTVGGDSVVGPFARIRPETNIGKSCKIGNFVEVKKSNIGDRSKVSHLSYVGDSVIGSGTNVGAGCVTCNYDGVKKSGVSIGNDSFIGSGSIMIAPVSIGDGVYIGASSLIKKDVEDGVLLAPSTECRSVKGGARKFLKSKKK
ncbi:NTP transferase domain-containing protein [Rickettsiales bacterium]|nr:NTP transferase domain-containing protein [Rickettsiales bacterium]